MEKRNDYKKKYSNSKIINYYFLSNKFPYELAVSHFDHIWQISQAINTNFDHIFASSYNLSYDLISHRPQYQYKIHTYTSPPLPHMKSITIRLLLLLLFPFVTPIPSPATFHDVKKRFKLKQTKLRKKKQFTNQPTIQQPNNFQQIQTTIKYVGHDRTPVIILDDLLPHNHYLSLRNSLRKRTDFYEGHGNKVNFPGKIASLDRLTVDPIIDALLSSKLLAEHFPPAMFDKQHIGAFASILCNPWGITTGVHHDFANSQHENIKAPAAVFYFGFDGATSNAGIQTGTAFFREKISGLERATSIAGNQTNFCNKYPLSIVCPKTRASKQKKDIELYDETDRVVSQPNRLVLYPQDLLHKAWVETKNENNNNEKNDDETENNSC